MATNITPVKALSGGVDPGMVAADAAGNDVANVGQTLVIISTGATPSDVTITAKVTARPGDGQFPAATQASQTLTVGANSTRVFGPFPACFVNANGAVEVRFSAVTNVKIGAVNVA